MPAEFTCNYVATCDELRDRILALIPAHPEILRMTDASELHGLPGFDVSDLDPSGAMVQAAIEAAQCVQG